MRLNIRKWNCLMKQLIMHVNIFVSFIWRWHCVHAMQIDRYGLAVTTVNIPLKSHLSTSDFSWPLIFWEFGERIEEIFSPSVEAPPSLIPDWEFQSTADGEANNNQPKSGNSTASGPSSSLIKRQRRSRRTNRLVKYMIYLSCIHDRYIWRVHTSMMTMTFYVVILYLPQEQPCNCHAIIGIWQFVAITSILARLKDLDQID